MKKLVSMLLAMTMLFCAVSALAEDITMVEVENEPSYEGQYVNLGDTGLAIYVPADFQNVDTTEDVILAMSNGEIGLVVTTVNESINDVIAEVNQAAADGTVMNVEYVSVNAIVYLTCDSADYTQHYAYIDLDESTTLCFGFVTSADCESTVPAEIIGSMLDAEDPNWTDEEAAQ